MDAITYTELTTIRAKIISTEAADDEYRVVVETEGSTHPFEAADEGIYNELCAQINETVDIDCEVHRYWDTHKLVGRGRIFIVYLLDKGDPVEYMQKWWDENHAEYWNSVTDVCKELGRGDDDNT